MFDSSRESVWWIFFEIVRGRATETINLNGPSVISRGLSVINLLERRRAQFLQYDGERFFPTTHILS